MKPILWVLWAEPGVQAEQTAEMPYAPATGGGGARDKNTQLGLREFVKKLRKILL